MTTTSLVLHVPHASTYIPDWVYDECFLPREARGQVARKKALDIAFELEMMTDWFTDELFDHGLAPAAVAPVSRLVCDMERFQDDAMETMSKVGMGVCYTHGFDRKVLKEVNGEEKETAVRLWYDAHHAHLTHLVNRALEDTGMALVLDCHSFHPEQLPYETETKGRRPDICIGTDPFHTDPALARFCKSYFETFGYRVSLNDPFRGALVPMDFYRKEKNVQAVMVEVNRSLYLEPDSTVKNDHFKVLRRRLGDFERSLIAWTAARMKAA